MAVHEGLLHWMERVSIGKTLDGCQRLAVGLDCQHGARLDRLSVDVNRARSTARRVTPDVGAGESHDIAQVLNQQRPGLDVMRMRRTVYLDGNFHSDPFGLGDRRSVPCLGGHFTFRADSRPGG